MFEKATKMKLRFPFRGQATVEDLWDLGLRDLDNLYKSLKQQEQAQAGESLLEEKSRENEVLDLQIEIVRHVVAVKLAEREAAEQRAERIARKQKILSIIAEKQDAELYDMPLEELQALVSED